MQARDPVDIWAEEEVRIRIMWRRGVACRGEESGFLAEFGKADPSSAATTSLPTIAAAISLRPCSQGPSWQTGRAGQARRTRDNNSEGRFSTMENFFDKQAGIRWGSRGPRIAEGLVAVLRENVAVRSRHTHVAAQRIEKANCLHVRGENLMGESRW